MKRANLDALARAVIYEGYILYPYRPSVKNRQRWTFGGLYPPDYPEVRCGSERARLQTECLVRGKSEARLRISVRFLHLQARIVGRLAGPLNDAEPAFDPVDELQVDNRRYQTWQEAVEREVELPGRSLAEVAEQPFEHRAGFSDERSWQLLEDDVRPIGVLVRKQETLDLTIRVSAQALGEECWRVRVDVCNQTPLPEESRDAAELRSLASTHVVLEADGAEFVSLADPPPELATAAAECHNDGLWPVLVGEPGARDTMLAAPIILYDYPQIAPESPGDLFDGTEIDEILSLRILTLTDEEKEAARAIDPRAEAMLTRTEALAREQLRTLHGTFRESQEDRHG